MSNKFMDTLPIRPPPHSSCEISFGTHLDYSTVTVSKANKSGCPTIKPKQSKSRDGCVTCKGKRLKCDELKPTCHQCHKRGVPCGGYQKDFKWRPFELESVLNGKSLKTIRKGVNKKNPSSRPKVQKHPNQITCQASPASCKSLHKAPQNFPPSHVSSRTESAYTIPNNDVVQLLTPPPPGTLQCPRMSSTLSIDSEFSGTCNKRQIRLSDPTNSQSRSKLTTRITSSIGVTSSSLNAISCHAEQEHGPTVGGNDVDDEVEEISRSDLNQNIWDTPYPSPTISTTSSSDYSDTLLSWGETSVSAYDIFRRPAVTIQSPELLLLNFDKRTCGIMSIKDGPKENPWRTLIWPLAHHSSALYHAISSMTAFHMSRVRPQLRVAGIEHMRKSLSLLASGISDGNISNEAALGTTLVLAFSEAFDTHISFGVEHLRGARVLLNQALVKLPMLSYNSEGMRRLQFLHNVWVYLDVLARLTSDREDDFCTGVLHEPLIPSAEVDPLLGCAATLYPLIGRAASLSQRVRKLEVNSDGIIADAMELKDALESWAPENYYEPPEDPSSNVAHSITTAEAYRWATLLYLHQAVPEIPSLSAHELAKKAINCIASIPPDSRCCIIHIYPLLATSCEAITEEERNWVRARWEGMMGRMWIGNVDKSYQVVKEVWGRRDSFLREWQLGHRATPPRYGSPLKIFYQHEKGDYEYEVSVKGSLHWLGVMKDWGWEVLLG